MRGGLIFPREGRPAQCRGFASKRLMGFEPTTFCMAIREVSGALHHSIRMICRAFMTSKAAHVRPKYAWIGADMPRFGHFRPEVPEIEEAGLIAHAPGREGSD